MSIRGKLQTFDIATLIQILAYELKTGRLTLVSKTNQVQIFFQDGDIVFATESRKNNRIGMLLLNNGIISTKALDECLAISRQKKQFIGKTLVETGYITLAQLNDFLLKQAENTIYNVFLWQAGEFEYNDEDLNIKIMAGKRFDSMNILLEASRRIDELEVLKKKLQDDQATLRLCMSDDKNRRQTQLSQEERLVLSVINGDTTIRQIIDKTGFDDFTGYKAVYSLVSYGLVEIIDSVPTEKLSEQILCELQGIDGKKFRETLDYMGLNRSSQIRIALARIFRDAADEKQLLETVREEAGKLSGFRENAELARLKHLTQQPFMKSLLELLWREAGPINPSM
ncbi:MAG: DUF4388 domain-containing protein [Desulfobacterales bacterium]